MRRLHAEGLSHREIGARFGLSRQAIWRRLRPKELTVERAKELERMRAQWRAERDSLET